MKEPSILVVDDDSDVLEMADFFFKEAGVDVHCAENGAAALEKIQVKHFTVMLTDFNMPGMNGLELAEKVRVIAPATRIILTTGQPSQELSDPCRKGWNRHGACQTRPTGCTPLTGKRSGPAYFFLITSPSFSMERSTSTVSPSVNFPSRSIRASGSWTLRCSVRFRGRAP